MTHMGYKGLAGVLETPLDTRDTADVWRFGYVYTWSPAVGKYLCTNRVVNLKPGESLMDANADVGGLIACIDR